MIKIFETNKKDLPYRVKLCEHNIMFTQKALIELRDKINEVLE